MAFQTIFVDTSDVLRYFNGDMNTVGDDGAFGDKLWIETTVKLDEAEGVLLIRRAYQTESEREPDALIDVLAGSVRYSDDPNPLFVVREECRTATNAALLRELLGECDDWLTHVAGVIFDMGRAW